MRKKKDELPVDKTLQKVDLKQDLSKADDHSRRVFIQRSLTFLAAFGVPWFQRLEVGEKISKRIFGSSTAFAQSLGAKTFYIEIGMRAGYPQHNIFCSERDVSGPTIPNRNLHCTSAGIITIDAPTTGGRPLYLTPQASGIQTAGVGNRIAHISNFRNVNGHTSVFGNRLSMGPSPMVANAHAMSSIYSTTLSQPVVFGNKDSVDHSQLGNVAPGFAPTYVGSTQDIISMFSPFQLSRPGGGQLGQEISQNVFDVINNKLNGPILEALKDREGGDVVDSGFQKLRSLLNQNLTSELDLTTVENQSRITALSTGVTVPNARFNVEGGNIFEIMVTIGNLIRLGAVNTFGINISTGDWHNVNATQGMAEASVDNTGGATVQAAHAAFWGNFIPNLLSASGGLSDATAYGDIEGEAVGDNLVICMSSEFDRTAQDNNDNGDGGAQSLTLIAPADRIRAGTYGNISGSLGYIPPNPSTGADNPSGERLEREHQFGTLLRVMGRDPDEYNGDGSKIVSAALRST